MPLEHMSITPTTKIHTGAAWLQNRQLAIPCSCNPVHFQTSPLFSKGKGVERQRTLSSVFYKQNISPHTINDYLASRPLTVFLIKYFFFKFKFEKILT